MPPKFRREPAGASQQYEQVMSCRSDTHEIFTVWVITSLWYFCCLVLLLFVRNISKYLLCTV